MQRTSTLSLLSAIFGCKNMHKRMVHYKFTHLQSMRVCHLCLFWESTFCACHFDTKNCKKETCAFMCCAFCGSWYFGVSCHIYKKNRDTAFPPLCFWVCLAPIYVCVSLTLTSLFEIWNFEIKTLAIKIWGYIEIPVFLKLFF